MAGYAPGTETSGSFGPNGIANRKATSAGLRAASFILNRKTIRLRDFHTENTLGTTRP